MVFDKGIYNAITMRSELTGKIELDSDELRKSVCAVCMVCGQRIKTKRFGTQNVYGVSTDILFDFKNSSLTLSCF